MDNRVVIFVDGRVYRIKHGINPADYEGQPNCLVNPETPRGVSPDLWRLVDGKIVALEDRSSGLNPLRQPVKVIHNSSLPLDIKLLLVSIVNIVLSVAFSWLFLHH